MLQRKIYSEREKRGNFGGGKVHCSGRIINCTDEEVINERHRKWYKKRDKEHQKHFNKEVASELNKMILQRTKEGDLVENLAQSGRKTGRVHSSKKIQRKLANEKS